MSEYLDQCALFAWASLMESRLPELRMLFHIPNGGKRDKRTAALLKASGVRAGVPDLCLPVASQGGYHALYIELKHGKNRTTSEQLDWLALLDTYGNATAVAHGWQNAARLIVSYLGKRPEEYGL